MKKRLSPLMIVSMLILMCFGCDPAGMSQMNLLGDLLNSELGPTLTTEQLLDSIESLNRRKEGFSIHFPVTAANATPKADGIYVNPKTGSTMEFNLSPADDLYGMGTVTLVQQTEGELSFGSNLSDSIITLNVQSRGRGIYALYSTSLSGDSIIRRCWSRVLLYVYPGADSIMTTRATEATTHIFRFSNSN